MEANAHTPEPAAAGIDGSAETLTPLAWAGDSPVAVTPPLVVTEPAREPAPATAAVGPAT